MQRILIVEDEPHLAQGLKYNLESEQFQVDILATAEQALPVFSQYDMMILDVMLPEMDGVELLERIRESDHRYPVLILSAKTAQEDRVAGLTAGADDYMTKPFSLGELILRIKRILKRQTWYARMTGLHARFYFGDYWIDFNTFEALTNNGSLHLTQYECYIMKYLIENKDRPISREELLDHVWGYREMETRTVDMFLARLRKLFEQDRKNPRHLKSIRSVGYRFYD